MSYAHPERLWLLAGVVALLAAYVVAQGRRRRAVERYTNPALLPVVAPDRAGGRRHLAPALVAASLAAVVVAMAEPARAEDVAREEGVVVLAVDVSASMESTDVAPRRIDAAIAGAADFVEDVPEGIHVGLVAFDGGARLLVSPTTDHGAVLDAIADLRTGPGTAAGEGVYASLDAIEATLSPDVLAGDGELPAAVVLLSDGTTTVGRPVEQAAAAAADAGVPVTTIAFGTPSGTVTVQGEVVRVPADTATMAAVADATGGDAFEATTAGQLHDVYADINTIVGTTTEDRPIARPILAAALALAAAATAYALVTGARAL